METKGTLHALTQHLVLAVSPLREGVANLPGFRTLMYRLGWNVKSLPPEYMALAGTVDQALTALEGLGDNPSPEQILGVLDHVRALYTGLKNLTTAPDGVDATVFLSEIAESLFDLLLADYLNQAFPSLHSALLTLNIITQQFMEQTDTRPGVLLTRFHWDQVSKVLSEPDSIPTLVYGWGTNDLDFHRLAGHLLEIFVALDWPAYIGKVERELSEGFKDIPNDPATSIDWGLTLPLLADNIGGQEVEVGLALLELPPQGGKPAGLILQPLVPSVIGTSIDLTEELKLDVRAGSNIAATLGVLLRPGDIALKYPLQPGSTVGDAGFGVTLRYAPASPAMLLGTPGQSRLELKGASTSFTIEQHNGELELRSETALQDFKIVIAPGDLDGFLGQLLGNGETAIPIELALRWSSLSGFSFLGGAGLEVSTAPHLRVGPVRIDQLTLAIKANVGTGQAPGLTIEAGVALGGDLGPIAFSVEGIGLKLAMTAADGNAGPFDIQFGFKPPSGIGLEVGGGGFTGGGIARYDPVKEEYSGGLELVFQDRIAVRALAVLSTRLPDGRKGMSLLIAINAEFEPIQLSFGFTLLGVGGLLGLNRTAEFETLRSGIKDGVLKSILFPVDLVANASRIFSDLGRVFPAKQGVFLIGPMAKIGWGTPALVTLDIGIILELPRPAYAVIGVLRAALPVDEESLIVLQVGFIGTVDFAGGKLEFDASLFDSRILSFPLSGDIAVRVYWRENANLLLSVGGFHPSYTPPPMNLRPMSRLGIVLAAGNPHVRGEMYLAITANTLQIGARIEVSFTLKVFNIYGFLSFDVLIQRSPFHFIADISAMVAVRSGSHVLFSIQLQFTLEGPAPLRARGTGSFEIGFVFTITIRVHFDIEIDTAAIAALLPLDVLTALLTELAKPMNWRALLPGGRSASVSQRKLPGSDGSLLLNPAGRLEISQKVLPLNSAVHRFGSTTPDTPGTFRIVAVDFGSGPVQVSPIQEEFAPAQFFEMTDAEKLSRPSFSQYDSGVAVGDEIGPNTDWMQSREVSYEVIYIPERKPTQRFRIPEILSAFSAAGSAVANSPLSRARTSASPLSAQASVLPDRFTVVSTEDLSVHQADLVFDSATGADQAMGTLLAAHPELTGRLQVMPAALVPTLQL